MTTTLDRLDEAVQMLAKASTLSEVSRIRNMARAAEQYARAERLGDEAIQYATDIRIQAARKGGEILIQMRENGERARSGVDVGGQESPPVTLDHLGITKNQASRWQKIAKVPEPVFEEAVAEGKGETAIAKLAPSTTAPDPAKSLAAAAAHNLRTARTALERIDPDHLDDTGLALLDDIDGELARIREGRS